MPIRTHARYERNELSGSREFETIKTASGRPERKVLLLSTVDFLSRALTGSARCHGRSLFPLSPRWTGQHQQCGSGLYRMQPEEGGGSSEPTGDPQVE